MIHNQIIRYTMYNYLIFQKNHCIGTLYINPKAYLNIVFKKKQ